MTVRTKKATNVSLDPALVAEAKALGISLSLEFERFLTQLVAVRRQQRWVKDNEQGFVAYERYVEKHGVWNEDERGW